MFLTSRLGLDQSDRHLDEHDSNAQHRQICLQFYAVIRQRAQAVLRVSYPPSLHPLRTSPFVRFPAAGAARMARNHRYPLRALPRWRDIPALRRADLVGHHTVRAPAATRAQALCPRSGRVGNVTGGRFHGCTSSSTARTSSRPSRSITRSSNASHPISGQNKSGVPPIM